MASNWYSIGIYLMVNMCSNLKCIDSMKIFNIKWNVQDGLTDVLKTLLCWMNCKNYWNILHFWKDYNFIGLEAKQNDKK